MFHWKKILQKKNLPKKIISLNIYFWQKNVFAQKNFAFKKSSPKMFLRRKNMLPIKMFAKKRIHQKHAMEQNFHNKGLHKKCFKKIMKKKNSKEKFQKKFYFKVQSNSKLNTFDLSLVLINYVSDLWNICKLI